MTGPLSTPPRMYPWVADLSDEQLALAIHSLIESPNGGAPRGAGAPRTDALALARLLQECAGERQRRKARAARKEAAHQVD